jgi:hypothetical protein
VGGSVVAGSGGQPAGSGGVGGVAGIGGGGMAGLGGKGGNAGAAGASPGACLMCITTACEAAQECFENPDCVEGIICGAGACAGLEGGPALACWVKCFGGDAELAAFALEAALCLAENCAVACQP